MNEAGRPRLAGAFLLLFTIGVIVLTAGCAAAPLTPTPTAIPLAATATAIARPIRQPDPTATDSPVAVPTESPEPAAGTCTATAVESTLSRQLAERTTLAFLDRLVSRDPANRWDLYLTQGATRGAAGQVLSAIVGSEASLEAAHLLVFKQATPASYEGRALLHWAGSDGRQPATQTLTLTLAYDRGLWLIDALTLGDLVVAEPSPTATAAPSGQRTSAKLKGRLVFQISSGGDLYVIGADGSGLRRLTDGLDPAWSPDGTQIAFTRWRIPWGLYIINADGSGEKLIAEGTRLKEAAWSPDSSKLVVTTNISLDEPFEFCLPDGTCFILPPLSFGRMLLIELESGQTDRLPMDPLAIHAPTWNPVPSRIVYAGQRGLAWIDPVSLETGEFGGGSGTDNSPAYSPDGQRIAYMSRVHNRWEIFTMNATGDGRQQLTHSDPRLTDPPSNVAPTWSPDGKRIAFLSNRDGPWRVYVMDADGSKQRAMFGDKLDGLAIRYEFASERVLSWSR